MKASLTFRDDQRPLARAKVPISILGLPFLSGASAGGDARDLRLDLATAFDSGPSLRLSYRPNDPSNPFTLVLKSGTGAFGSPVSSPMSISAEFNLLARDAAAPIFSILFKPRVGDFNIRKITRSPAAAAAAAPIPKISSDSPVDSDGEGLVDGFPRLNGIHPGRKLNGFAADLSAAAAGVGGIHGLLSGIEVTARSVLPLRSRAAVKFRWGVRVPPELRAAIADDNGRRGGIPLNKMPLLVMSKISIEHVPADEGKAKGGAAAVEAAEACASVKRQLEAIQTENGLLRKAIDELRADARFGGKAAPTAGSRVSERPPVAAGRKDRRSDGKAAEKASADDVSEELKKALMGATGAGI